MNRENEEVRSIPIFRAFIYRSSLYRNITAKVKGNVERLFEPMIYVCVAATSLPNPLRGVAKRTELQMFGAVRVDIRMPCRSDVV